MANKRELKKVVDLLGANLCENMMISWANVKDANRSDISEAVGKVLNAVEMARKNSNITFDRGVKAFENLKDYSKAKADFYKSLFNKITADFNKEISDALKLYNSALPASEKESNKASVAK